MLLSDWSNYDTKRIYDAIIAGQNPNTGFFYDYLTSFGAYSTLMDNLNDTTSPLHTSYYNPDPVTVNYNGKKRIRVELAGRLTASGAIYTVPLGWTLKVTSFSVQGINTAAAVGYYSIRVGAGGAVKAHSSATPATANANSVIPGLANPTPITWAENTDVYIQIDAGTFTTTGIVFNIYGFIEKI